MQTFSKKVRKIGACGGLSNQTNITCFCYWKISWQIFLGIYFENCVHIRKILYFSWISNILSVFVSLDTDINIYLQSILFIRPDFGENVENWDPKTKQGVVKGGVLVSELLPWYQFNFWKIKKLKKYEFNFPM